MPDIVVALAELLVATLDFDDTIGKAMVWDLLWDVANVDGEGSKGWQRRVGNPNDVVIHESFTNGVAAYSTVELQVNIFLLVPICEGRSGALARECVADVCTKFPGYAVSTDALLSQLMPSMKLPVKVLSVPRRFVPLRTSKVAYDKSRGCAICEACTQLVEAEITNVEDVCHFRPLALCKPDDDPDTVVYWTRAACGTLIALKNPFMPFHFHDFVVPTFDKHPDRIFKVLQAIGAPVNLDLKYTLLMEPNVLSLPMLEREFVNAKGLPFPLLELATERHVMFFGISDDLIKMIGSSLGERVNEEPKTPLLWNLYEMHRIRLRACDRRGHTLRFDKEVLRAFPIFIAKVSHPMYWEAWCLAPSSFAASFVRQAPNPVVASLCRKLKGFKRLLHAVLREDRGHWTAAHVWKARLLTEELQVPSALLQIELDLLEMKSKSSFEQEPTSGKKKDRRRTKHQGADAPHCAVRKEEASGASHTLAKRILDEVIDAAWSAVAHDLTHHSLVRTLEAHLGLPVHLFGSGVFCAASDADVVITMEAAPSLQQAYDEIQEKMGWTPCYNRVRDDRVAVLRGTFRGVRIDAQIWRGPMQCTTPSERDTARALALAARLVAGADAACVQRLRKLHAWATATSLKGHQLCRMPGLAVTCFAIVFGCHSVASSAEEDVRGTLAQWRTALTTRSPVVDFDKQAVIGTPDGHRCHRALDVRVDGRNVATRMIPATTRHLLDILAFCAALEDARLWSRVTYDAWRAEHMLPCIRLRPKAGCSVPYSLHVALRNLGEHPIIDTLHVTECAETDELLLLATLCADAHAAHYGFRDTDVMTLCDATDAIVRWKVQRSGREWFLLAPAHRTPTLEHWAQRTRITDILPMQGQRSVPNAPTLTVDAAGYFAERYWDICM